MVSVPSHHQTSTMISTDLSWHDVYPPLTELRREMMTDAQWDALSD
jgi:hypothetical protein